MFCSRLDRMRVVFESAHRKANRAKTTNNEPTNRKKSFIGNRLHPKSIYVLPLGQKTEEPSTIEQPIYTVIQFLFDLEK